MITITLLGRGGQAIKSAARMVSTAAFLHGYYVQDQPLYGAERRGAPISAFIRISRDPILARGYITHPLFLVIADDSLLQDNLLPEITKDTVVFVNSMLSEEKIRSKHAIPNKVVTYDLTKLALDILGKPIVGVAIASVACKLIDLNIEDLKQSIALELKDIGIRDAELAKNIELARVAFDSIPYIRTKCFKEYEEKELNIVEVKYHEPKVSTCSITSPGNASIRRTGDWSVYKPVIDYNNCTKCMICFVYCPDSAITIDKEGFPVVNYDICKGCDICYTECPTKTITIARRIKQ
ncbi:MAG: 2-oxoacid:acceptor oxidoreductase family protein [Nitrososphaerales archaeon]